MVWSNMATAAVIIVVIGFTLLPIWPDFMKKILWYCSVTFLIVTLLLILLRFLVFLLMWMIGYEFWIFPRLFDESLSFTDSFKPIYSFEKGTPGQGYYRVGLLLLLVGFVYWACTQPTEFDGFVKAQKEFLDDLYSGNLLADVAHDPRKLNTERLSRRVPNLEDLLRDIKEDERIDMEANSEKNDTAADGEDGQSSEQEMGMDGEPIRRSDDGGSDDADDRDESRDEEDRDAMIDELLNSDDEKGAESTSE